MTTKQQDQEYAIEHQVRKIMSESDKTSNVSKHSSSSSSQKPAGIVMSPAVLMAALVVIVNSFMGFGLWAIQDRLDKYDGFEPWILSIEKVNVKFEDVVSDLNKLINDFSEFSKMPRFDEVDFDKKTGPIVETLARIERTLSERLGQVATSVNRNDNSIRDLSSAISAVKTIADENVKELETISSFITDTRQSVIELKATDTQLIKDIESLRKQYNDAIESIEENEDRIRDLRN